jgi:hypothetical protein
LNVHRRRFALAYSALALVALVVTVSTVLLLRNGPVDVSCSRPLPAGSGLAAVRSTTALWVTDVLMQQHPGCGYRLASRSLRDRASRRDWASGKSPVQVFRTHYPVASFAHARPDSLRTQAVYTISRHFHDLVQIASDGEYEAAMAAGLAAPDAGVAAYTLELRLEDGGWRVDRCLRVRV